MSSKPGFKSSGPRYDLALKLCYCKSVVKSNAWRDNRRPNVVILKCFICRWEGNEVEREEGKEVARWKTWETDEAGRREILAFIQGWETLDKSKISSFCF